jgi:hypothetical protein
MQTQSSLRCRARVAWTAVVAIVACTILLASPASKRISKGTVLAWAAEQSQPGPAQKKVMGRLQTHPGGPIEDVEVAVREAPANLPEVEAEKARLKDDELVLGVVVAGQAVAYPIRYLAMFEVVNGRVGQTPVASTW